MTNEQKAYTAGFLDGDGYISAKIERTTHCKAGFRVRLMVGFAQHTKNRRVLEYIQKLTDAGTAQDYPTKHMSELVIRDRTSLQTLIQELLPYLIVKKSQAHYALKLLDLSGTYKFFNRRIELAKLIRKDNFLSGRKLSYQTQPCND